MRESGEATDSRTPFVVALCTVASRLTGFARVFVLAYAFSFTGLTDAYNMANVTPNIIFELVAGGVLSATLVPVFVHAFERDGEEAWVGVSAVATVVLVVLTAVAAVLALIAPVVVRLYTFRVPDPVAASDQAAIAGSLLRLFSVQVVFYGVAIIGTALLNARGRFIAPMAAPILNNLAVISVLLGVASLADDLTPTGFRNNTAAILLLGIGTSAGVVLQAIALVPSLRRAGARSRLTWNPRHPMVLRIVQLGGWTAGIVIANQVTLWFVLVLASRRAGDVSAYQAAYMFLQLPFAVVGVTVMTMLAPRLAQAWARDERGRFSELTARGVHVIAALVVPAAAGYLVLSRTIVGAALEHGRLGSAAAGTTADVLAMFAIGLPGFCVFLFLVSAMHAMHRTRMAFWLYVVENGANVVLATVLYARLGVRGLGLALALAYSIGAAAAVVAIGRRGIHLNSVAVPLLRVSAASAFSVAGAGAATWLGRRSGVPIEVEAVIAIVIGLLVYVAAARVLAMDDLRLSQLGRL